MKNTPDKNAETGSIAKSTLLPEMRREPRRPAHGVVHVEWADPVATEIHGTLVDVSDSGFRMAHACAALESGRVVKFTHREARGSARVVWTRVLAQEDSSGTTVHRVESGFLVLASPLSR